MIDPRLHHSGRGFDLIRGLALSAVFLFRIDFGDGVSDAGAPSAGVVEGLNNKARLTMKKACG